MSDNIKPSGTDEQTSIEKILFLEADLKPCLTGTFKYHIHEKSKVPKKIRTLWENRGYKPMKWGVAHLRFEGKDKKYIFPAYFKIQKVEP